MNEETPPSAPGSGPEDDAVHEPSSTRPAGAATPAPEAATPEPGASDAIPSPEATEATRAPDTPETAELSETSDEPRTPEGPGALAPLGLRDLR